MNNKELWEFLNGLHQEQANEITGKFFNELDSTIEELETDIEHMKSEIYIKEKAVKFMKFMKTDMDKEVEEFKYG